MVLPGCRCRRGAAGHAGESARYRRGGSGSPCTIACGHPAAKDPRARRRLVRVIGAAGQRAASLYSRSCREGHPDRIALARWLVRFRVESPGWPDLTLADFVAAFDERAMAQYRTDVRQPTNSIATRSRFEVDRMLPELADHDGDVHSAIEVLTRGERPAFGGIVWQAAVRWPPRRRGWVDRPGRRSGAVVRARPGRQRLLDRFTGRRADLPGMRAR